MVVGFNHNFSYKGTVYHIQTEDNGVKSPTIVTLLYHGGTILASRKTSYADIARVDNLEQVVEELMKEQHKGMLRSLKNGEFDEVIVRFLGGAALAADAPPPTAAAPAAPPRPPAASESPPPPPDRQPVPSPATTPPARPDAAASPSAGVSPAAPRTAAVEASLDEIILSYLMGEDK